MLERNIRSLQERRNRDEAEASMEERLAQAITRFTGSMAFVYIHIAFFGFWIVANLGWIPVVPKWDESFVILAMWASVEAIFLSTFVLISQNRMQTAADRRADLDLQISLLAEHEITKLTALVSARAAPSGPKGPGRPYFRMAVRRTPVRCKGSPTRECPSPCHATASLAFCLDV